MPCEFQVQIHIWSFTVCLQVMTSDRHQSTLLSAEPSIGQHHHTTDNALAAFTVHHANADGGFQTTAIPQWYGINIQTTPENFIPNDTEAKHTFQAATTVHMRFEADTTCVMLHSVGLVHHRVFILLSGPDVCVCGPDPGCSRTCDQAIFAYG